MSTLITIAGGSSELTIGTTPISLGSVGRILFQGSGDVLQESSNLFWDNTNGRLGVGTSTPAHSFEVKNTVGGASTPTISFATSTYSSQIIVGNSTYPYALGANSMNIYHAVSGAIGFYNGGASPSLRMSILSDGKTIIGSATSATKVFEVNNLVNGGGIGLNCTTGANTQISITHTVSGGNTWTINSAANGGSQTAGTLSIGSTTNNMLLFSNGNTVLGALNSADAGYKLDVNGTARVSGDVTILNKKLVVDNTSNNTAPTMMSFINNGSGSGTGATFQFSYSSSLALTYGNGFTFTHNGSVTTSKITNQGIFTNGSLNAATNLTFEQSLPATIKSNGQATDSFTYIGGGSLLFQNYAGTSYDTRLAVMKSTGNVIIQNGGTFTDIASARLQVNSTTQGFLPPRMTTAEKNAIASPAAGLVVYDTTLNKLCVYTTAWETITSV